MRHYLESTDHAYGWRNEPLLLETRCGVGIHQTARIGATRIRRGTLVASITRFDVRFKTSKNSGAGTDGDVYVGLGGREFYVDSDAEDFAANADRTYTFGIGANVKFADSNNPADPFQLLTEDLSRYPAYVRFVPRSRDDNWNIEFIDVKLNPGPTEMRYWALSGHDNIWLGVHSGLCCYLHEGKT
jgi:hypothetical protein